MRVIEQAKGRVLGRRRRANAPGGRHHRHEVKVSPEEEALLQQLAQAQGVSVPRLLVETVLASPEMETPTQRRDVLAQLFGVYRLLGSIANNVNQMAKATNATGEVGEELVETMRAVRRVADRVDATIDELAL
jgi:Bacterial mobilisation protein (MobC)